MLSLSCFLRVVMVCLVSGSVAVATPDPVVRKAGPGKTGAHKAAASPKAPRSLAPMRPVVLLSDNADAAALPVTLRGGVKGSNGKPLAGATVWVSGTTQQVVVTNAAGNFSITLPNAAPIGLSCGYSGYQEQSRLVQAPGQQPDVSFTLQALDKRRR